MLGADGPLHRRGRGQRGMGALLGAVRDLWGRQSDHRLCGKIKNRRWCGNTSGGKPKINLFQDITFWVKSQGGNMPNIDIERAYGRYTIYVDGEFWSTCESMAEVAEEMEYIRDQQKAKA